MSNGATGTRASSRGRGCRTRPPGRPVHCGEHGEHGEHRVVSSGAIEEVLERAGDPVLYSAWATRAAKARWCRHPVRLSGASRRLDASTGEVLGVFSSENLVDGVLLKACGQRRTTACAPCAEIYRGDAFQLIATGLAGGKGVRTEVSEHPAVLVTLTAPSFGPVHSCRERNRTSRPCRPDARGRCAHGVPRRCIVVHQPGDVLLGQAICGGCFDYEAAVLWNATVTELWRRTSLAAEQALAEAGGITRAELRSQVRISYAKVIEYQARGLVHVHAVVRLDGADHGMPPGSFDAVLLVSALQRAGMRARAPLPMAKGGRAPAARWGDQLDVRPIVVGAETAPARVGAYIAKYTTKSTDASGVLDHRLSAKDLAHLDGQLSPHLARMVRAAWDLGGRRELADLNLRAWAHCLGYRGHWVTKSRRYSTTFAALRSSRQAWSADEDRASGDGKPAHTGATGDEVVLRSWSYAGRGYQTRGDAWLAETAAAEVLRTKRLARQESRRARAVGEPDQGHPAPVSSEDAAPTQSRRAGDGTP